jgi:hypothetical protein
MARPSGRKSAPSNETPAQKFVRLANMRVTRLIRAYRGLGALGAKTYESTTEQRKAIETALKQAHDHAIQQLSTGKSAVSEFKL